VAIGGRVTGQGEKVAGNGNARLALANRAFPQKQKSLLGGRILSRGSAAENALAVFESDVGSIDQIRAVLGL
jgi:hypothetical protein